MKLKDLKPGAQFERVGELLEVVKIDNAGNYWLKDRAGNVNPVSHDSYFLNDSVNVQKAVVQQIAMADWFTQQSLF